MEYQDWEKFLIAEADPERRGLLKALAMRMGKVLNATSLIDASERFHFEQLFKTAQNDWAAKKAADKDD